MTDRPPRASGSLIADRYCVLDFLGEGGMSRVYRVRDKSSGRELALKEHKPSPAPEEDQARRVRFRREFHTIARLRHPTIVRAYDYGFYEGRPHYTMELLRTMNAADFRGDVRRTCAAIRDLAAALSFLHNRRLVHRDVAIKNVGLASDGSAKLLDFGMVAAPGTTGEIAGTLPYIAPEAYRGVPLDPRADVYGLGVLAFVLLTGTQPKPMKGEQRPPPPPSSVVDGVPASVDKLVSAMLSPHPLVRPQSADVAGAAAEVGELNPLAAAVSVGYFASPPLVGRDREMETMRGLVQRALDGFGGAAVVEGESGTGKSRILDELAVEAQVAGAVVVRARAGVPGQRPYGVVQALARAILALVPSEATEAAREHATALANAVPQLGGRQERSPRDRAVGITNQKRLDIQSHVCAWLLDVAHHRAVTILIDDLQRCDEPSAAVLATLAESAADHPIALVMGFRTDEESRASGNINGVVSASTRLRLGSLEPADIDQLLRGIFGETPYLEHLATWVHRLAGSRPMHCIGLVRDLVDRSVIRYTDGLWVIPRDLSGERLPDEFAKAIDGWLMQLSETATRLGRALAVYRRPAGVPLLLELIDADELEVFSAIDELTYAGVLVGAEDSLRFRHDSFREGLLKGIAPPERRRLHSRTARVLELQESAAEDIEEIGWHSLRGGLAHQGAQLLERAGREHFERHDFADAIPPLVAALEVHRNDDPDSSACMDLEFMLMKAGAVADRNVAMTYSGRTLATMRRNSGFGRAERLRRWLGTPLAMLIGTGLAGLMWVLRPRRQRGPGPLEAAYRLSTAIMILGTNSLTVIDEGRLEELVSISRPFRLFRNRIASTSHLFVSAYLAYCRANITRAEELCNEVLRIGRVDQSTALSATDRRVFEGVAQLLPALGSSHAQDGRELERIAKLRELSIPMFDLAAQQLEVMSYRIRGEEDIALELEKKAELLSIQIGSVWQTETVSPVSGSIAYTRTHDIRGLRRCIEELERLVARGDNVQTHLLLTEGTYFRLQGRLGPARERLEAAAESLSDRHSWLRGLCRMATARLELASGNYELAKSIASAESENLREGHGLYVLAGHATVIALSDAYLGDPAKGRRRLLKVIDKVKSTRNLLALFDLHEAVAEIARLSGDVRELAHQVEQMRGTATPTRNPALLVRVERWERELAALRSAHTELEAGSSDAPTLEEDALREDRTAVLVRDLELRLRGCVDERERAKELLETLIVECVADRGYLFTMDDGQPELLASTHGDRTADPELLGVDLGTDWQAIPLWRGRGDARRLVGLAALVGDDARPAAPAFAEDLLRLVEWSTPPFLVGVNGSSCGGDVAHD